MGYFSSFISNPYYLDIVGLIMVVVIHFIGMVSSNNILNYKPLGLVGCYYYYTEG